MTVKANTDDLPAVSGQKVYVDRVTMAHHNLVEAEDVLAFAPNLTIRKRYIGDQNAIIGGRAAGTTQSARSLVYANGLLLSDFLDSGYANPPRWGMVGTSDIDAIDILYGPFSALYPGNSMGTTVLFHTHMPRHFQAQARAQWFSQDFSDAYGEHANLEGHALDAAIGSRHGRISWRVSASRLQNDGQPMTYAMAQPGGDAATAIPVTGVHPDRNPDGSQRLVVGSTGIDHTRQTRGTFELGLKLSKQVKARFTVGWWQNHSDIHTRSLLRDADGSLVTGGSFHVDGALWHLRDDALAESVRASSQRLLGLQVDGQTDSGWHWQTTASRYDFLNAWQRDAAAPDAQAGTIADTGGSGWETLDVRTHGPIGQNHVLYAGAHWDRYLLDSRVHATDHWRHGGAGALTRAFGGRTVTDALYLQDEWSIGADWLLTTGLRAERWRASHGLLANADTQAHYPGRTRSALSPKAALAFFPADGWQLRLSVGRAVRFPTVGELFQGSLSGHTIVNNDPDLKPERAWAEDLTLEHHVSRGHWRVSLFHYRIRDSLYRQTDVTATPVVTRIDNIDQVRIRGVEAALQLRDVGMAGIDIAASAAWNDAVTVRDRAYPMAEGKQFPRIPRIRAKLTVSWRFAPDWQWDVDGRRSGGQYSSLDNSDFIDTFGAVSSFTVFDTKLRFRPTPAWTFSVGVNNLGNRHYWVYHPWPGRTVMATVRWSRQ